MLQALADTARAVFGARAVSIMVADEAAGELVFAAVVGRGRGHDAGRAHPGRQRGSPAGCWRRASRSWSRTSTQDPRFAADFARSTGYVPKGIMTAPILGEDGPIGVISVLDRPRRAEFSLVEVELLERFCHLVALALAAPGARRGARSAPGGRSRGRGGGPAAPPPGGGGASRGRARGAAGSLRAQAFLYFFSGLRRLEDVPLDLGPSSSRDPSCPASDLSSALERSRAPRRCGSSAAPRPRTRRSLVVGHRARPFSRGGGCVGGARRRTYTASWPLLCDLCHDRPRMGTDGAFRAVLRDRTLRRLQYAVLGLDARALRLHRRARACGPTSEGGAGAGRPRGLPAAWRPAPIVAPFAATARRPLPRATA